jgi:hypothetical protein
MAIEIVAKDSIVYYYYYYFDSGFDYYSNLCRYRNRLQFVYLFLFDTNLNLYYCSLFYCTENEKENENKQENKEIN